MSKITKNTIINLKEKGFESSMVGKRYLELAKKDDSGVPRSTGIHRVRLIKDELVKDVSVYVGKEKVIKVQGIRYYFFEDGEEKIYDVPLYQKDYYLALAKKEPNPPKKYHYLLDKFAEIDEGDEIEIEYVQKGFGDGYIDVRKVENGVDGVVDVSGDDGGLEKDPFSEPLGDLEGDFQEFVDKIEN